jgi:hypothetical protein
MTFWQSHEKQRRLSVPALSGFVGKHGLNREGIKEWASVTEAIDVFASYGVSDIALREALESHMNKKQLDIINNYIDATSEGIYPSEALQYTVRRLLRMVTE